MEKQDEDSSDMGPFQTPEFAMWAFKFMGDYFTEHPYATEEDMTTAMYEAYQNKIKSDLGDLIGDMIQEYVDIRSQMENPKEVKESDIKKATEQCPYFKSMHKALNYSNHFRGHLDNYDWDLKGQASGQGPSTSSQGTTDAAQSASGGLAAIINDCDDMCYAFHNKSGDEVRKESGPPLDLCISEMEKKLDKLDLEELENLENLDSLNDKNVKP